MRLPTAAAAGLTGLGMPQTHHLAGSGPPSAAREPLRPPNGRSMVGASRAAAGSTFEQSQNRRKSDGNAAREGGGGGGGGGGDARHAAGACGAVGGVADANIGT